MQNLPSFSTALGALGRFLRQITAEIGDVAEVEIGTAKRTVRITIYDLACGTVSLAESRFGGYAI
jgi:hypothetical protein